MPIISPAFCQKVAIWSYCMENTFTFFMPFTLQLTLFFMPLSLTLQLTYFVFLMSLTLQLTYFVFLMPLALQLTYFVFFMPLTLQLTYFVFFSAGYGPQIRMWTCSFATACITEFAWWLMCSVFFTVDFHKLNNVCTCMCA